MLRILFFLGLFLVPEILLFGQKLNIDSLRTEYDQLYGQDIQLFNGRKYYSEINPVQGHVFWRNDSYFKADIYLQGKKYSGQQLKYNLIAQQFVMANTNHGEERPPIILINSLIDSIRVAEVLFVKNPYPEIPQAFVQQIYRGKISCFAGFYKRIYEKFKGDFIRQAITPEKKTYYLVVSSEVKKFQSSKSFLKCFSTADRKVVRQILSQEKLNVKQMDDSELAKLVGRCCEISGSSYLQRAENQNN